jgi:hypothetical protein
MSRRINRKSCGPQPLQAELPMIVVPASLPPMTELVTKAQLVARHPHLLSVNRVTWALRCRAVNAWFLGLSGRAKPRAARRAGR